MAHSRSRSSRTFGNAPQRRLTAWDGGVPMVTTSTLISSDTAFLLGLGATPLVEGLTLIRIRGEFLISLMSAGSDGDGYVGAVGIGMASLPAFTAGAASLPMPVTEIGDENWLWHSQINIFSPSAGLESPAATQRITIDSKAMRKDPVGMALYFAVELIETGVATARVSANTRFLFKLP